jgi:predicted alpha/beta superfamily hydrolase
MVLRPWVHEQFPNADFDRDALYEHSFSGLFTIWTILTHPHLFDVYLAGSPFLVWNDAYIFNLLDIYRYSNFCVMLYEEIRESGGRG